MALKKGYVQIYTGNGKGKTTAALGLAFRGAGAGLKVYIGQFLKSDKYSDTTLTSRLKGSVTIEAYGNDRFVHKACEEGRSLALKGVDKAAAALESALYDIVVLDEINLALHLEILDFQDIQRLINIKPEHTELVLTGMCASAELLEMADLVTEMKEIGSFFSCCACEQEEIEK
jgi:cob(I)alamin adenosyltransferase